MLERVDETVDIGFGIVDGETGAAGTDDAEKIGERLGTVMANANGDIFFVHEGTGVVRVNGVKIKRDDAADFVSVLGAVDGDIWQGGELLQRVREELFFVRANGVEANFLKQINGGREGDDF